MRTIYRLGLGMVTAAFAACILMMGSPSANAATHMRHHRRHHHAYNSGMRYYHNSATSEYGSYPNIQYFTRNGHVYYKDLDTGETNLVRW